MSDELQKDRDILMAMRKVLTNIVREVTPEHRSIRHPLSEATIQDIRTCLGLITAREKELAELAGVTPERPYYTDQQQPAKVISMDKIGKIKSTKDTDKE